VQQTQIDFVDMPNAVQSEISVVNTVNKDYRQTIFCCYLANQILGGGGSSIVLNLRENTVGHTVLILI
jgi:hypothetical protein